MDTGITKVIALNILLIGLILFLSGCGNQVYTPEVSLISPTLTKTTSLPSATATVPATEMQLPLYPTSSENFIQKPSISGGEARKIIIEKGAGEDLKALENWYKAEGIIGSGMSNFTVPVVYQEGANFNWNLMVKNSNGNFLKFTITSGKEADQLVRAMGMVTYLGQKPSFEVSELKDPSGMESTSQKIIWDKSGWSVVGAFQGDALIAWFNADAPGGGEWVKVQEIVPTATPAATEIPFDTSRFEVVDATDGNKYQGYLIEDEYGPRLVDETNNIILVKEGDNWKPAESRDFSEKFPAVYWETKIGESDGFEIPITVGLSANVREGVDFTYSKIHMTQQGADDVAQVYLHYAWGRYKDIMGHNDIAYEDYLSLLREGKGNLEILDSITHERIMLDPRQGVSMVITGDKTYEMPLKFYNVGYNFKTSETGKLLYVVNSATSGYHLTPLRNFLNNLDRNNYFIYTSLAGSGLLTYAPNKCMRESVNVNCGVILPPTHLVDANNVFMQPFFDYHNGLTNELLFSLE